MIQYYCLLDDQSSPDPFRTEFQGWYNPTTFTGAKTSGYILNRGSSIMQSTTFTRAETSKYILNRSLGMMQSYHIHGAETSRYILNRSSRMMQSHHIHEDRSHRIYFGQMSQDDTIPLHSRGPRSSDHFWTDVPGWYNPSSFSRTEFSGSL